jgi:hypothetical protein
MKDCSVVTTTYDLGDGMKGTVGIIGPKRMDYDRVVNVLKEKYCEGEYAFLEESELDGIEALPQAPFYITKDGLAFYYHMYEVHWSALEGILPWDKVKNLLTDEAQELF